MDRILKIIFYGILTGFFLFTIYMTLVMYLSPRQDLQKRGFIPCTEILVYNITDCEPGYIRCPLKHLWQDMKCNIQVITGGFTSWINGEQKRPWSNYLFTPELNEVEDEIYVGTKNAEDTYDSDATSLFIAAKKQELSAAKDRQLNPDDEIILNNPEELGKIADDMRYIPENTETSSSKGDISDEALIGNKPENKTEENTAQGKENEK